MELKTDKVDKDDPKLENKAEIESAEGSLVSAEQPNLMPFNIRICLFIISPNLVELEEKSVML